jgi:hypothetical protein
MATTIPNSFNKFRQNLEITGLQSEIVSSRQQNVRRVVEAELSVTDSFLTGSYQRSTMIAPLSEADIDIFVVLDPKYFHNYDGHNGGQAGLLDLVKRALKRTYISTPDISRNGQAVTIRFTDFVVDVVPGFNRKGGGYIIPNSINQNWISTDPKRHVEIFTQANQIHKGSLVPLIKMIKSWNRNNSKFFSSFHLEVLALQILNNVTISDFSSGVRFYFDKGRSLITQKNLDPAGYGGDVGGYLNTQEKISQASSKFQLAYERSILAEDFAARGKEREAIDTWIKIFGDYFPAYG